MIAQGALCAHPMQVHTPKHLDAQTRWTRHALHASMPCTPQAPATRCCVHLCRPCVVPSKVLCTGGMQVWPAYSRKPFLCAHLCLLALAPVTRTPPQSRLYTTDDQSIGPLDDAAPAVAGMVNRVITRTAAASGSASRLGSS